eukprot:jgi/Pico_ML_1/51594/g2592.t1
MHYRQLPTITEYDAERHPFASNRPRRASIICFCRFRSESEGGSQPVGWIDGLAFAIEVRAHDDVAAVRWFQRGQSEDILEFFFARSFVSQEPYDRFFAVASRIGRILGGRAAGIPLFIGGLFGRNSQFICVHGISFFEVRSHARVSLSTQGSGTAQGEASGASQEGRGEVRGDQEEHQSHQHAHVGHGEGVVRDRASCLCKTLAF